MLTAAVQILGLCSVAQFVLLLRHAPDGVYVKKRNRRPASWRAAS